MASTVLCSGEDLQWDQLIGPLAGALGCADLFASCKLTGVYTLALLGLADATGGWCIGNGHSNIRLRV